MRTLVQHLVCNTHLMYNFFHHILPAALHSDGGSFLIEQSPRGEILLRKHPHKKNRFPRKS